METLRCLDPDKYNIVRCHEWFHRNDQTFVVFEVLDMSLYDYISQTKRAPLPLNGIRTIVKDVRTQYQIESRTLKLYRFATRAHPLYSAADFPCRWPQH